MATAPTDRTRLRRKPDRAHYDSDTIYGILDQGLVCHVAFLLDGQPTVIPTAYGRVGDRLHIHGARSNRALKTLAGGADACVEVTLLDALVAGRSPMRHSMNYRSVVIYGRFDEAETEAEKLDSVSAILDHIVPGRREELRTPTTLELTQTRFLSITLDEASAKIRAAPPNADPDDNLTVWSGILPFSLRVHAPIPADEPAKRLDAPGSLSNWSSGTLSG